MALDLQLSTAKARQELQSFVASLTAFEQKLASAGKSGGALEARLQQLANFKGIQGTAIASLNNLASAVTKLANSGTQINNISRNLNSLARVRVDAVAANVQKISAALAGLRAPPNLDRFAATLQRISTAAAQAAGGMRQFSAAANSVRVPAGLNAMPGALARIGASSRSAAGGMSMLGGVGRMASSTLAGFGVVLGAFGFARFIQGTYDAVRAVDRFTNIITATQGANAVGKEMAYIEQMATKLKLPIEGLIDSYGKFSAAALTTGESVENVHKIFESMSTAARVLKLDKEQLKLAFKGLEQMYSKGTVSMEELRRQWGEQIPGGFAIASKAMGLTQQAMMDLVESGKLAASDFVPKLAAEIQKTFGPGLQASLVSAQAAMDNFGNAVWKVSEAFGRGFFDAFKGSLDGLATAMQDPAFIDGVRVFGKALGIVLNGAITLLKLVAQNWDAVKWAIMGVITVGVAATVYGWVMSLAAAGQAAYALSRAMGGVALAVGGWGFISSALVGLRGLFMGLLAPVISLAIAMRSVAIASSVLVGLRVLFMGLLAPVISLAIAMRSVAIAVGAWGFISSVLVGLRVLFMGLLAPVITLAIAIGPVGWAMIALAIAIGVAAAAYQHFFPPAQKAADAMNEVKTAATEGTPAMRFFAAAEKAIADAAARAAAAAAALGDKMAGAGAKGSQGAKGLREFAAAAGGINGRTDLPLNESRGYSGETGGVEKGVNAYGEYAGYAGGGIAGRGTNTKKYSLSPSAFINAPSFAGGGLSDGGIPAVLHPNEAVVPLAGGGTIPVMNMSGGQSSLMLLKPLNLIVDYSKQTKTEVARVWEAISVQTLIMRNAFERSEQILHHIDNSRLVDLINSVNALKNSMGGGGGGGFSSGSFDTSGAYGQKSNIDKVLALMDADLAYKAVVGAQGRGAVGGTSGQGGIVIVGGQAVAAGSKAWFALMQPIWQGQRDLVAAQYAAGMLSEEEVSKMLKDLEKSQGSSGGFAMGSPNASRDANGAFNATLHSDEAVIPLPDGRTVPVTIKSDAMQRINRFLDSQGNDRVMNAGSSVGGGARMGGVTIQVNMQVNAKDAASFNASKDQIMRDLKTELDRAARTIGNRSDIDDPTRRV